jgi:hypothetical protein
MNASVYPVRCRLGLGHQRSSGRSKLGGCAPTDCFGSSTCNLTASAHAATTDTVAHKQNAAEAKNALSIQCLALAKCHLVRAELLCPPPTALMAACKLTASAHDASTANVTHKQSAEATKNG